MGVGTAIGHGAPVLPTTTTVCPFESTQVSSGGGALGEVPGGGSMTCVTVVGTSYYSMLSC